MALERIAHIGLQMPFWLLAIVGNVKPQGNIFLLGPPKVGKDRYLQLGGEAAINGAHDRAGFKEVAKREFGGTVAWGLFMVAMLTDVQHMYEAYQMTGVSTQRRVGEAIDALAVSPNFGTLLSLLMLLELYICHQDGTRDPLRALTGKPWQLTNYVGEVSPWQSKCSAAIQLTLYMIMPILQLAFGGVCQPLDEDAVLMMPSQLQRYLVRFAFYTYKPVYHCLMAIATLAMLAYVWLLAPLFVILMFVTMFFFGCVLPRVVKMRRCLGVSNEDIHATLEHLKQHRKHWEMYLLAPSVIAFMLPLMVPLALRLVGGGGYWTSLYETWNDRHLSTYINALGNKVQLGYNATTYEAGMLWANLAAMLA